MEWVETTAKTIEEAKDAALDQLGVGSDDAEFEVVEEPKAGLFGRVRGQARVRARVKPAQVRPKQERRRRSSKRSESSGSGSSDKAEGSKPSQKKSPQKKAAASKPDASEESSNDADTGADAEANESAAGGTGSASGQRRRGGRGRGGQNRNQQSAGSADNQTDDKPAGSGSKSQGASAPEKEKKMSDEQTSTVTPEEVGAAAHTFVDGLVSAFGAVGTTEVSVDGTDIAVAVSGDDLGRLVGPKGRTLVAVQDLARVASQRRLGDHDTRLKVDVGGYRERRQEALERFTKSVAATVREAGEARSLEPMNSSDRKVVHDVLNDEPGVGSRSEGEDPNRRVIIVPE